MDFQRIQIQRVVRHKQTLDDQSSLDLLKLIFERGLEFDAKITGGFKDLERCSIVSIEGNKVTLKCHTQRVKISKLVSEIVGISIVSNVPILPEDGITRWDMIDAE